MTKKTIIFLFAVIGVVFLSLNRGNNTSNNVEQLGEENSPSSFSEESVAGYLGRIESGQINSDRSEVVLEFSDAEATDITISNGSVDDVFTLEIGEGGINSLMGVKSITFASRSIEDSSQETVPVLTAFQLGTDWVGPYIVEDLKNGVSSEEPSFTGGWHGKTVEEKELGTATLESVKILMDGVVALPGQSYVGEEVVVEAIHLINGFDTDYPVIKEKVTYRIYDRTVVVSVEGEALSDISIMKYYGLQSQNGLWKGDVLYVYEDGSSESYSQETSSHSKTKKDLQLGKVSVVSLEGDHVLEMFLNHSEGLGDLDHIGENEPQCFTQDYGKTYFNLINGKNLILVSGERYSWEGSYVFK